MARTLTKKRRGFVNDYADTGNATEATIRNFNVKNRIVAKSVGSELLTFPAIQEELKKLGFDSNNARRVIGEILNDEAEESKDRIKAAENIFKVNGDYAPEKHTNLNIEVAVREELKELANGLLNNQRQ